MPFIGTFAAAKIQYQGTVYDLWQSQVSGADQEEADSFGIGPWVTAVTLQLTASTTCQLSVSLEAPYMEGIKLLESGLFTIGNLLSVRLGYSRGGFMTPWYAGKMGQPSVQLSPGGLTATLVAQGAGAESMLMGSGRSWGPGTRWSIVEDLADKYGLEIDDPEGAAEGKLSEQTDFEATQAGSNDWSFMKDVCNDVGVDIAGVVNPESQRASLRLSLRSSAFAAQPARTFVAMGAFDLSKNQYPVYSFSTVTPPGALYANAAMKGVRVRVVNDEGEEEEFEGTPDDLPDETLAEGSMDASGDSTAEDEDTGLPDNVSPDGGGADDEGAGVVLADAPSFASQDYVYSRIQEGQLGFPGAEVSLSTTGIPYAQVYELFELRGVSAMFNGKYMTKSVAHAVNTSGFETTIVGMRNALGLAAAAAPNQNTTEPAEDGEGVDA